MPSIPEQGQLVEVRGRQYSVVDVKPSGLLPDPLSGGAHHPQHLISLVSVEDDAFGEELDVVWEIEPGARAHERSALPIPTSFDEPSQFDAFLNAVRWGAVSSADRNMVQAPFRSGIAIEDYQLEPLARALDMPRVNLLVADDVGLGKTIEAGMVAQELMLRHRVRSVLVVCPASLQQKWQDEMRDKFGLEFRIIDSAFMKDLRRRRGIHVNPWTHFPRLITSLDFIKRERPLRLLRETFPPGGRPAYPRSYDLLILDEAHNAAPAGGGHYAMDSLRTMAVREIAPHFEHKLFITATPHNGYHESFSALLELLDNQRFARGVQPDRKQVAAVVVRRMKEELKRHWDGSPRFATRILEPIEVPYSDEEKQIHASLRRYTASRVAGAASPAERLASEFVLKLLKKRLFSSPAAFASTLTKHLASIEAARKKKDAHAPPAVAVLRKQIDSVEEEYADDETFEDVSQEVTDTASRLFRPLSPDERDMMRAMSAWAEKASAATDSKARELLRWVGERVKPRGVWTSERVIIFTEYRRTQQWLQELLVAEGLASKGRLELLYGGMDDEHRERIKAAFQADPEESDVRILLATDAASEGIDLQNHCSMMIHYEIPWNPNRLEQRNGRIDRWGQRAPEVRIFHFVGKGYDTHKTLEHAHPGDLADDLEFLMKAALKVNVIREDIGKVGPVLARQVEEAMLGSRRTVDTGAAEKDASALRRILSTERRLRERVAALMDEVRRAQKDMDLGPENVFRIVETGLRLAEQPALQAANVPARDGHAATRGWMLPPLTGIWSACADGMLHPHTRAPRPLVFDPDDAKRRDDVVLGHLHHRLVAMCLRLLRAEVWASPSQRKLARVTARLVDDSACRGVAVVAHGRLLVLGSDGARLHEEVLQAGGLVEEGKLTALKQEDLARALDGRLQTAAPDQFMKKIQTLWSAIEQPLRNALQRRVSDRSRGLAKLLEVRCAHETQSITSILTELAASIRAQIDEPEPEQLELWTNPEREQLQRNMAGIRRRLEEIPGEIEAETLAIRKRYAAPEAKMFPVAIEFLIPKSLAR